MGKTLRVFLCALVAMVAAGGVASVFTYLSELPLHVKLVDAHTMMVHPYEDRPLPAGLKDGDRIDLTVLDRDARAALVIDILQSKLPTGRHYDFAIIRDGAISHAAVTTAPFTLQSWDLFQSVISALTSLVVGIIAMLLLWRGRDAAAYGLTVWTLGDFPTVYFVSVGAPARTTDVLATYGIHEAFDFGYPNLGVAAMMSALPILIPLVIILMRRVRATGVQL